jgi:hypothetical protein
MSEDRLFVLDQFLSSFNNNFSDSDIYIGINYACIPQVEDILINSGLSIIYERLNDESLYTYSDASAYQIALKLLNKSNAEYEYYWFIHTKGAVNSHSDYLRQWYIDNLINRRLNIENLLHTQGYGSYGLLGLEYNKDRVYSETDVEIPLFENILTDTLPYTHAPFFYIHTMYVICKKPIKTFFNYISDKWYNTNLNRYYFEGVFPFLVSRSGNIPYLSNRCSMNKLDLAPLIENWIRDNTGTSRKIDFESYYEFDQLRP